MLGSQAGVEDLFVVKENKTTEHQVKPKSQSTDNNYANYNYNTRFILINIAPFTELFCNCPLADL